MTFNLLILFLEITLFIILVFSLIKFTFKKRKRSAESIYKLINELEKRYIH